MDLSTAKYRITYEAFSKFSASISKAENLEQLIAIIQKKSKYLFDYRLLRTTISNQEGVFDIFTYIPEKAMHDTDPEALYDYEKQLLKDNIPFCKELDEPLFNTFFDYDILTNPLLWGWHFDYNGLRVCVSVLSDDIKRFVNSDIEILHLVVDTMVTKQQELQFKKELEHKNENLREAVLLIEQKNAKIYEIVENQKNIIAERTKEIRGKNEKLLEISKLNSHNVREPLSRILGIVEVIGHLSAEEITNGEVIEYLKNSAEDLDGTLQEIIEMSANGVDKFAL